ncbi:uncharacterized protein LOC126298033 [Schistocerca gregaria]|uniref:uncharacterized protein LOC126298033 n=1 Tax=Schistocerca gregaria TaxID=7010 RepID=UPI00211DF9F0|nr:uncharacterized protein LOC126298033 [Schistocerca gregaria]
MRVKTIMFFSIALWLIITNCNFVHHLKDHVKTELEGPSSSTTIGYNNDSVALVDEDPTQCPKFGLSNGETTKVALPVSTTTTSEAVTGVTSQSNTTQEGLPDVVTFGDTSVAVISQEIKTPNPLEKCNKQGRLSSTSIRYSNASLMVVDEDPTHPESSHRFGISTEVEQPTSPAIMSEVVPEVSSQPNTTPEVLINATSFGTTSVTASIDKNKFSNPGETDKDPVKPSIVVTILICIFILIGGMLFIYIRSRSRPAVTITIRPDP